MQKINSAFAWIYKYLINSSAIIYTSATWENKRTKGRKDKRKKVFRASKSNPREAVWRCYV